PESEQFSSPDKFLQRRRRSAAAPPSASIREHPPETAHETPARPIQTKSVRNQSCVPSADPILSLALFLKFHFGRSLRREKSLFRLQSLEPPSSPGGSAKLRLRVHSGSGKMP